VAALLRGSQPADSDGGEYTGVEGRSKTISAGKRTSILVTHSGTLRGRLLQDFEKMRKASQAGKENQSFARDILTSYGSK